MFSSTVRDEIQKEREAMARERADHERELDFDRERAQLELDKARLQATIDQQAQIKTLNETIAGLNADLKIERAKNDQIKATAKSEYAEHVMAVADERLKEIQKIYEGYAKNLTEVVKAANTGDVKVSANIGNMG